MSSVMERLALIVMPWITLCPWSITPRGSVKLTRILYEFKISLTTSKMLLLANGTSQNMFTTRRQQSKFLKLFKCISM